MLNLHRHIFIVVILLSIRDSFCHPSARRDIYMEIGPLSIDIYTEHDGLSFLGTINGKYFYIERIRRSQNSAYAECISAGMKLASIDTQAELNFISATTTNSDGYMWSDGRNCGGNDCFMWAGGAKISKDLLVSNGDDRIGLAISRYTAPTPTVLQPQFANKLNYYICVINST